MNFIISISKKQLISYIIWISVFVLSFFLYYFSLHILPSFILLILNSIICIYGISYTYYNKNIYFFSPIFQTLYCMLFYCGLIGLFYFSKFNGIPIFALPTTNELLLKDIALIYLIFCIMILSPYLIMSGFNKKIDFKFKIFQHNFQYKRLIIYLIVSQSVMLLLLILLFIFTGYTPLSALSNPLGFRFSYAHDFSSYIYTIFNFFIKLNLCIVVKFIIIDKLEGMNFKICAIIFILFYFIWAFLSGSRSWFLYPLMYSVYIYSFKKLLSINLKKILLIILSTILVIMLVSMYYWFRNYQQALIEGRYKVYDFNIITTSIERIDNFSNSVHFFKYIDSKYCDVWNYSDFKLSKQIVSQFTNIIPRKYLPHKGYPVSGELTSIIFPQAFNHNINLIFGGVVNLFYTGGIAFVVWDALLFGLFVAIMQFNYQKFIKYDLFLINYIIVFLDIPVMYFSIGIINTAIINPFILKSLMTFLVTFSLIDKKSRIIKNAE